MLPDKFIRILQLLVEEDSVITPRMKIRDNIKPFLLLKRLANVRALYAVSVSGDC